MTVGAGYKQTDLGFIPEDWNAQTLSEISDVRDGTHESPKYQPRGIPLVTSKNILDGKIDLSDVSYISVEDAIEINRRSKVDLDDIIISMIGTVGNAALVDCLPDFCIKNVALIKSDKTLASPAFLAQVFRANSFKRYLLNKLDGGIQKFVSLGMLRNLDIAVPPTKAEQEAIAQALSDADALIESLEQLIAKKRQIKQGAMRQLLTGRERLPGFNQPWREKLLGGIGAFLKGSGVKQDEASSGKLACIRYGELYTKHDDIVRHIYSRISPAVAANARPIHPGDILFAGSGETRDEIGKCAAFVGQYEAYAGGDIVILRPREGDPAFYGYYLNSPPICEQKSGKGQGDAVVHISATALAAIEIRVPELAEQTAIAEILSEMDAEITELETKLAKARQIKQGMMQQLLTGRIRLVEPEAVA